MLNPSPTTGARDPLSHIIIANTNPVLDDMFKIVKGLLNLAIKPAIEVQTQALKKMVTQKLITMLSTITTNQDKIY